MAGLRIVKKIEKVKNNSDACIYEIRALSKLSIKEKLAKLKESEIKQIQEYLCSIVGNMENIN